MKAQKTSLTRKPTAVSLFTGCGGSDAGLVAAGFDVIMANDISAYAREVYLANHHETDYQLRDIQNICSFPKCDLLVGCYPCQGFSQGGAREPSRAINYLYREFGRALRQIQPKAFIVENVSGMTRADYSHLLRNQLKNFRHAGYVVTWKVLNAADFGVPQDRHRIIIVGLKKAWVSNTSIQRPVMVRARVTRTLPFGMRSVIYQSGLWESLMFNHSTGITCLATDDGNGRTFQRQS